MSEARGNELEQIYQHAKKENVRLTLHVVSTTAQPVLVIITVYEPKPPKWVTPTQRSEK